LAKSLPSPPTDGIKNFDALLSYLLSYLHLNLEAAEQGRALGCGEQSRDVL